MDPQKDIVLDVSSTSSEESDEEDLPEAPRDDKQSRSGRSKGQQTETEIERRSHAPSGRAHGTYEIEKKEWLMGRKSSDPCLYITFTHLY